MPVYKIYLKINKNRYQHSFLKSTNDNVLTMKQIIGKRTVFNLEQIKVSTEIHILRLKYSEIKQHEKMETKWIQYVNTACQYKPIDSNFQYS